MPQIGWFELLIIVVIAILVIGPKDFPHMLKKVGSWIGTTKKKIAKIQNEVSDLKNKGINPTLATILVGSDPSSETYVRMKRNTCKRVGMESIAVELPESTTTEELLSSINSLNNNEGVHGILLQHPVPSQIDERKCFDAIDINKDVDGVTCLGGGNMAIGFPAFGSSLFREFAPQCPTCHRLMMQ